MSNDLIISESGAAGVPATDGLAGGVERAGFASLPVDSSRKAEIEAIMRTDFDRYEREGLDREMRKIIEAELVAADPESATPTAKMDWMDSRQDMVATQAGAALVRDWESMGGFRTHLDRVQDQAGSIVRQIGEKRAQRVFMARFDEAMTESARYAVYDTIREGAPSFVVPASEEDLTRFKSNPVGVDLVQEWGSDAPENVAIVWKRVERLKDRLSEEDQEDFFAWFETLEPDQAKAIIRNVAR